MIINETEYPNYFQAADKASKKAQDKYLSFVRFDLLAMIGGAVLSIYNFESNQNKLFIYIISGILLLTATILSFIIKSMKSEDVWYQARAFAESCKTLTWRYMMCSELFEHELTTTEANSNFNKRIKQISDEFIELNAHIDAHLLSLPVISPKMKEVRGQDTSYRKRFYIKNRIENQKKWYADNAKKNKDKYDLWFKVVVVSQILAIIAVASLVAVPSSTINLTGLFTTLSGCAFSWIQLKDYQMLKQAYTTTVGEINLILEEAETVTSEEALKKFVLDSENAISREHTMWLAQKRKL